MRSALVAGWIAFVYLLAGSSSAHFWLDSGEIGAAAIDLGVMHPPGAAGLGLLMRLAAAVPVGSLGFRVAMVSALFGAAAVGLVVAVLRRRGADGWVAWGAAAWLLCGWTFVRQARVAEIYALSAVLLMVALWGLDPAVTATRRTGRRLLAVFAATWAAWCFGDLRLALVPLCAVVWALDLRRRAPWTAWAPLVVIAASTIVLTLPLASMRAPTTDWGDPDTLAAFWDHVQARSIRDAFAHQMLPASPSLWWHHLEEALSRLAEDLGPAGPTVAAIALVIGWTHPPSRRAAAALTWVVVVELVYAVGINPMGGPDRQTGLVLAFVAALVVADGLRRGLSRRPRLRWAVPPLLWTVLALPAAVTSLDDHAATRSWGPHAWSRGALAQLPPGTLLLTQSDDLAAGVTAAAVLEGARPDVAAVPAQHLHKGVPEAAIGSAAQPVWEAASRASTERDRIVAAIEHHDGPVALEHPATGLFEQVRWWPSNGRIPLRIRGAGAPAAMPITDEIDAWLPRLPSDEDRHRLAVAIAAWARAVARTGGSLARAGAALEQSLQRVDPDHASALVTLAALRDTFGDTAGAIVLTRRALEIEPDRPAALLNLALFLGRDPDTRDEALALAERAVALRPWRADGWSRLAALRELAGDDAGAAVAREAAALAPVGGDDPR